MFNNNVKIECVPKRVYEFCLIALKKEITELEMKNILIPKELNNINHDEYYNAIKNTAVELKLVAINNGVIKYSNDIKIKTMDDFRFYCNSIIWENKNDDFYKFTRSFLESNLDWINEKNFNKSDVALSFTRKFVGDDAKKVDDKLLGMRFWISFLGFGYFSELGQTNVYIPNMSEALLDFIKLSNLEKNKTYTVREFVNNISVICDVCFKNIEETKTFNFAFSSALRLLHDKKLLNIKKENDAEETWHLYKMDGHEFSSDITHIFLKGVGK